MFDINYYSESKAFWSDDTPFDPQLAQFCSLKGRLASLSSLLKKLGILPFALLKKLLKTAFRLTGFSLSCFTLLFTLGLLPSFRRFFEKRATSLSKDLVDWILYPFSILGCIIKHLLATTVHPKIHYRF